MRILGVMLLTILTVGCTSMATPPPPSDLPPFAFSNLRGTPVQIVVMDQRAGERDSRWTHRVENDLARTLTTGGTSVLMGAATRFEVRILRARSDFENRQWTGCVELTGRVVATTTTDASGDACVTKSNLWGKGTADNVLRLAYQDAMVKMLSALDAKLSQ